MTGVVFNEILATNIEGIVDEDGDHSDWIELKNTSEVEVNLAGWRLTDDAGDLGKWTMPGVALPAGGHLRLFASDKNRALAGHELHTNFKLAAEGEYLALVMPDGVTIADSFTTYPPLGDDVSFGLGANPATIVSEILVGASSPLTAASPTGPDLSVDDLWREIGFNDAGWLTGLRSVGFDRDGVNDFAPRIGRTLSPSEMPSTGSPRYTAYVRYEFHAADPEQLTALNLNLRFDDGFIAYLNGREIARANFGEDFLRPQPSWDSRSGYQQGTSTSLGATNRGPEALEPVDFDLSPYLPLLTHGENVLAFHVVNSASASAGGSGQDFVLEPVLTASRARGSQLGFMTQPTPGRANGVSTLGFAGDTHFSVDRGFFAAPFPVTITADLATAAIRYTTDGSEPTPTSGTLYSGPIMVSGTTTLRAMAYQAGYSPSNIDTQTYIFLSDVITQDAATITQPYAPWGHDKEDEGAESGYNLDDEADWEMDPQIVDANLATILEDLKAIPTVSLTLDWDDLFGGTPLPGTPGAAATSAPAPQGLYVHGTSSERRASFEYFNPSSAADQVQADVAVEIQGHSSTLRWNTDKMSLQVKFKFPYGDTELDYPLFADSPDGAYAAREFDTLILDAGYNYGWTHANAQQRNFARYVSDQVVADLQNLASGGGVAPHGRYVHLYLNGLYWGLYNMHERPDDSFAAEAFGGSKDDYYVVKATNQDVDHEFSWVEGGLAAEQSYLELIAASEAVAASPGSAAAYANVRAMLDVDRYIDYMIVHYYAGGGADWSHNNWYATRNRNGGLWRFHAWDQEHSFPTNDNGDAWNQTSDLTSKDDLEAPTGIHGNLIGNAEYRLRFADRVQALLHNGGVLTPAAARAVYEARTNEIDRAIVGESARWGDNRTADDPYTRSDFLTIKNGVLATFFPARTNALLGHFDARGWLPTLDAPLLSQYGGTITAGFDLTLTNPNAGSGAIYFTTDGSDPRLPGGGLGATATLYTGPVELLSSTRVLARVFSSGGGANAWSPLVDQAFVASETFPLRIVELNYNPDAQAGVGDAEDLEFIELLNTGTSTISLDGVEIADFATDSYSFAAGLTLAPGARIVVARNPTVFAQVYGGAINVAPGGYGSANLSNGGEQVTLLGPVGEVIHRFAYSDDPPWPTSPDGDGYSLEIIDPLGDASSPTNWRASAQLGGSPGTAGSLTGTPGDFDGDGDVDGSDFLAWQRGLGTPSAMTADGDADGDGDVDDADLGLWASNFGKPETVSAVTVPADGVESARTAAWDPGAWLATERLAPGPLRSNARPIDAAFATWTQRRIEWNSPAPSERPSRRAAYVPIRRDAVDVAIDGDLWNGLAGE